MIQFKKAILQCYTEIERLKFDVLHGLGLFIRRNRATREMLDNDRWLCNRNFQIESIHSTEPKLCEENS